MVKQRASEAIPCPWRSRPPWNTDKPPIPVCFVVGVLSRCWSHHTGHTRIVLQVPWPDLRYIFGEIMLLRLSGQGFGLVVAGGVLIWSKDSELFSQHRRSSLACSMHAPLFGDVHGSALSQGLSEAQKIPSIYNLYNEL